MIEAAAGLSIGSRVRFSARVRIVVTKGTSTSTRFMVGATTRILEDFCHSGDSRRKPIYIIYKDAGGTFIINLSNSFAALGPDRESRT